MVSLALQRFKDQCQLNSGSLHKQTRWNPLGRDVHSPVEDHDLVLSLPDNTESQTHSRVSECDGRPAVQVGPNSVNRMVTASTGVQTDMSQLVHSSCRSICQSPEPQRCTVHVSSPRPKCLGHLQGFYVEVAERIAAPQRSSTRTIYQSKWALFERWCRENLVNFSTPSIKQVSDFFMYLYQDLNRHPSTIDGYRTAIVDTLGPTGLHISQSSDLNRLLSSFHRDHPKSSRNLPKCNLSVVLNELTKARFEPMKDTDLKPLTLKTAFLVALASGKRHSEIHAWYLI